MAIASSTTLRSDSASHSDHSPEGKPTEASLLVSLAAAAAATAVMVPDATAAAAAASPPSESGP